MEVHIPWNIKAAISTAFPNCDTTGTWAEFCARIERYKPIVRWRQVRWMKPEIGKIKANTDGSFINENSRARIGGIIRYATGNLIMEFSVPARPTIKLKLWKHYMLPDGAKKLDTTNMTWNLILCYWPT
ncbi:hypothetical protein KY290_024429 [Solanum tuberosum]|uniref:RNase H family protein n=1 Tax=Solanum tuberosum TaxID=4113 RepID=A0ABQ7UQX1_SOLTU|nr:hypothetical protein KY290_024429 [Solanum tuberosum]